MNTTRTTREYLGLFFKGVMMGAADVVPGVSGGTIAFITGIYEELINTIKSFNPGAVRVLFQRGPGAFWKQVNGSFLLVLLAGIVTSIATIAGAVLFLLANYPVLLWAFFFGLILASVWLVMSHIERWDMNLISSFIIGSIVAYIITSIAPVSVEPSALMVFLSGAVAICAMILPGISGSFILLLLGMYAHILAAVKGADFQLIGLFVVGCVVGIMSFSRLLSWMFSHHRQVTLALLAGFMFGSLNKVWPWKYTLSYTINQHGEQVPLLQDNVLPWNFESITGQSAFMFWALGLTLVGIVIVVVMERYQAAKG
ncbi:DUF368 domain-containing protein [Amphritea pacifica]|uniref:DUF368 domain-containing protein n=1 Tax=Amphritea pacifica TaxID=2811233 RepID=A0ABS2W5M8_9GAMM|nr:DUF368 domain-containing protein [Amphritea pacifica]MBN0987020.1 DUF368 domain-containing protein [Amphritea pacifica]MBN1006367.1 DUF368 domain-containing protein [Amphritea pacifica]